VAQRRDVVRDLDDILRGHTWRLGKLEEEELGERRLGSFDLGREQSFFADVAVEKQRRIWKYGRQAVEPPERQERSLELQLERATEFESRLWWKLDWHECTNFVPRNAHDLVLAGGSPFHRRDRLVQVTFKE